jgi:hypothetical protein
MSATGGQRGEPIGDDDAITPHGESDPHPGDPIGYEAPEAPGDSLQHAIDAREDELDGVRIRQLAALRRGAYRARSYAIIGAAASFVVAVQLVLMTVTYVRVRGWGLYPIGYAQAACVGVLLGLYFGRRALSLHREIKTPARMPPEPAEPDFTTLSDGSQQWKNLEDIR